MRRLLTPAGKISLLSACLLTLLWLFSPARSERESPPGVVEIFYSGARGGERGPIAGSLDDAIRVFEEESRQRHAHDPSQPVYRVISGQSASRNLAEDPTRLLLGLAGGMPPDVLHFDRVAIAGWAARGAFLPLDSFLEQDAAAKNPAALHATDYLPAAWDEIAYRDPISGRSGIYGIPSYVEDYAMLYNKDLLRRAGFVDARGEAQPPRTWEELQQMAVRLTERDAQNRITRLGFHPFDGNTPLYLYGWMNGGQFLSPDGRTATLTDPKVVGALTWVTSVYDQAGGYPAVSAFQSGLGRAELNSFIRSQVAIKIDSFSNSIPGSLALYGDDLDYGAAAPPLPAREVAAGRPPVSWISGGCYAIPANARHPAAAWELIRFLSSRRAQLIIAESESSLAASQGRFYVPVQNANIAINRELFDLYVNGNARLPRKLQDAIRVYNELLAHSYHRPTTAAGQLMWNELITASQHSFYKDLSPHDALAAANKNVQQELDRLFRPPQGSPVHWPPLFWLYALALAAVAAAVTWWETSAGMRRRVYQSLHRLGGRGRAASAQPVLDEDGRTRWAQRFAGVGFALPWIIGFVVFTGGPIFFSAVISFCDYDILNPARFVGWQNYRWLFAEDPLFWISLKNTLYMVIGVPLGMAVSLGLALMLNQKIRGIAAWRTVFYLPSIVPAVAASILWIAILNPNTGLLNHCLALAGITGPNWLQNPELTKPALILMGLWTAGGGMIVWLAGLKGISESYYEAAELDGAGRWEKFWRITLPMLTPYIFFNLVMGLIGVFQIFSQAFIMTQGGPVNSTLFYAYHLFNNAFRYLHMGYASAMAWVLVVIVLGLTLLQMKLSNRWVHYEGE